MDIEPITFSAGRKPFASLAPNTKSKLFKKLEDTISLISGGALEDFFSYMITKTKLGRDYLVPAATKLLMDPLMKSIAQIYSNTPSHKKTHILSLVSMHSTQTLEQYGFEFTKAQLDNARRISKDGKATLLGYKRVMPACHEEISDDKKDEIIESLIEVSSISSYFSQDEKNNKKITSKKDKKSTKINKKNIEKIIKNEKYKIDKTYILNCTKDMAYIKYTKNVKDAVSRSTFLKNIPNNFKKAKRCTDMCPLCIKESKILKYIEKLSSLKNEENLEKTQEPEKINKAKKRKLNTAESESNKNEEKSKKFKITDYYPLVNNQEAKKKPVKKNTKIITESRDNKISCLKKELFAIRQHQLTSKHQKYILDQETKDLEDDQCIVIIDFKENLRIGGGPRQTKEVFFEQTFISDLGAAVLVNNNGITEKRYYNFFSHILSHDSLYSGDCIVKLFSREEMKKYKSVSIWSDGGKHFKSKEFLARIFEDIHKKLGIKVKMNYFTEYHGKNIVDGHFGTISQWLTRLLTLKEIKTIDVLIESFIEKEKERLESNSLMKQTQNSKYYFLQYTREKRNKIIKYEFKNIRNFLSFYMDNNILYSSIFSHKNLEKYKKLEYKRVIEDDKRKTKHSIIDRKAKVINDEEYIGSINYDLQMLQNTQIKSFGIAMEP